MAPTEKAFNTMVESHLSSARKCFICRVAEQEQGSSKDLSESDFAPTAVKRKT